jgi:hypothetical protein
MKGVRAVACAPPHLVFSTVPTDLAPNPLKWGCQFPSPFPPTARPSPARLPPPQLVRSANDSERDLQLYLTRAHGFLNKAPSEPDRTAILRKWTKHFGKKRVTLPKSMSQADGNE